jgi:hypothetical protein
LRKQARTEEIALPTNVVTSWMMRVVYDSLKHPSHLFGWQQTFNAFKDMDWERSYTATFLVDEVDGEEISKLRNVSMSVKKIEPVSPNTIKVTVQLRDSNRIKRKGPYPGMRPSLARKDLA